jgi:hypothetical protein
MKGPLRFSNFSNEPQITEQKWHQICSTVKFVELNLHVPILSPNYT